MLGGSSEVVSICAVICCSCDGAAGAFCIGLSSELLNTLRRGLEDSIMGTRCRTGFRFWFSSLTASKDFAFSTGRRGGIFCLNDKK